MIGNKTDETVNKIFESLLSRHRICKEKLKKCSKFVFDYVNGLHYKCNEIRFDRGGSYIESPK